MAQGSSIGNASQGTLEDLKFAQVNKSADGSAATAHATGAIWKATNCTASGTTVVKSGAGRLYGFYVGTATGNITIYDNTAASGTKIVDTSAIPAAGVYILPVAFGTGLTVVLSGAGVVTALYL